MPSNPPKQSSNKLIAIAGGIGAGKSVISRILRVMGYRVYDTDSEARRIMNTSTSIRQQLTSAFGQDIIHNGCIDRPRLAEIVFNNPDRLTKLNTIVHGAVISDLLSWCDAAHNNEPKFVETAILYESGLDKVVDEVWYVDAPAETRIRRVMQRNNLSRQQVEARLHAQSNTGITPHPRTHVIINDNRLPVLPQVLALLN